MYKGALYENIVGEALTKCGYGLYYYKREDSTLEEDFFVRTKESLLHGIKFTAGNIGYSDGIYSFPYFCAFLLKDYLKRVDLD